MLRNVNQQMLLSKNKQQPYLSSHEFHLLYGEKEFIFGTNDRNVVKRRRGRKGWSVRYSIHPTYWMYTMDTR